MHGWKEVKTPKSKRTAFVHHCLGAVSWDSSPFLVRVPVTTRTNRGSELISRCSATVRQVEAPSLIGPSYPIQCCTT